MNARQRSINSRNFSHFVFLGEIVVSVFEYIGLRFDSITFMTFFLSQFNAVIQSLDDG